MAGSFSLLAVPVLHAEVQVAGIRARCTLTQHSLYQPIDANGRPSSIVHFGLIRLMFTGEEALLDIWPELAMDSYRRVSGHVGFFHEEGHTHHKLTFYDAACVFYECRFDGRGQGKESALQVDVYFSPAAVDLDGAHLEIHTQIWWEKDPQVRFRALTKPNALLSSPRLSTAPFPQPTPGLKSTPLSAPPLAPKPPKEDLDPKKKPPHAPTIAKWYRKGGSIEVLANGNWKFTDWEFNSVVYEGHFPNFTPHARQQVDIPNMVGDCEADFRAANKMARLGRNLEDNTWHHHQNLTTMQEVPRELHARFTHYGARSIIKKRTAAKSGQTGPARSKINKKKP